jgi:hypothetical protein
VVLCFAHDRYTTGPPMQGLPDFQQNTSAILSPLMIPEAQLFDAFSEKLLTLPVTLPCADRPC